MKTLITGGSSEIAQAIALRRSRMGDEILFTSSTPEHLKKAEKTFADAGSSARGFLFDFDAPDSCDPAVFDQPIDALILNAFAKNPKTRKFHELEPALIQSYFKGNIGGNAAFLWRVLQGMIERRFGRLVYISSLSAATGTSRYPVYCASKAALEGLFLNLAVDYGELDILSNIVRPGIIATERTRRMWSKGFYVKRMNEVIPQRKLGTAEQVAEAIDPLLSRDCYMNGSILTVSGGLPLMRSEGFLGL